MPGDLDCLSPPCGSDRALPVLDTGRRTRGAAGDWKRIFGGFACIPGDALKTRDTHGLPEELAGIRMHSYYL